MQITTAPLAATRSTARVVCRARKLGVQYAAEHLTVKRTLGSGSFGQVFEGTVEDTRAVLKRVKRQVVGASEMQEMEHELNVYASAKSSKNGIAHFLGYAHVSAEEADSRITEGLWLLWKYEGCHTLAYYLKRRDCIPELASALGVDEWAVVPTVARQLLEAVRDLHSAGLVHRDVKPANVIFCEADRRFRLIDLGAAANLRTGTNYVPDESILDPTYCPPEQYVLPTDAPNLASKNAAVAAALAPILWSKHRPDRFDSYSAGLVILQLAVPSLRSHNAMKGFLTAFKACRYNLRRYRRTAALPPAATVLLDADAGAGWDFLEQLLRPRTISIGKDGTVRFKDDKANARASAGEALRHSYLDVAAQWVPEDPELGDPDGLGSDESDYEEGPPPPKKERGGGLWRSVTSRLFDMEAQVMQQATATELQTRAVKLLEEKVQAGEASPEELNAQQSVLASMAGRLASAQKDLASASGAAKGVFGGFFGRKAVLDNGPTLGAPDGSSSSTTSSLAPQAAAPEEEKEADAKRKRGWMAWARGGPAPPPVEAVAGSESDSEWDSDSDEWVAEEVETDDEDGTGLGEPRGVAPPPQPERPSLMAAAGNLFASGWRLTGAAARGAVATITQIEAEAEVRAERRRSDAGFLALLRERGVGDGAVWAEVEGELADDPRYEVVAPSHRQQLFVTFVADARRAARLASGRAERDFQSLLSEALLPAGTNFDEAEEILSNDPRWVGLTPDLQASTFATFMAKVVAEQRASLAAASAESEYRFVLKSLQPAVDAHTSWAHVQQALFTHPASLALPEASRKRVFEEYRAICADLARAESRSAEPTTDDESGGAIKEPKVDVSLLEALRTEQSRLVSEYSKLEAKLASMEDRLEKQSSGGAW